MSNNEIQPDEIGAVAAIPPNVKTGKAFSALKRELSDDELSSTGVQKLLLEELERLKEENGTLSSVRDDFHRVDKDLGIIKEKLKRNVSAEIISGSCLAVGAASLGYAPSLWAHQPSGWILIAFGVVLTVCGIFAKAKTV
jgi:hypothetical protein